MVYVKNGRSYKIRKGSRRQVWNGTAYTTGSLTKSDLKLVRGRLVSKRRSEWAKKHSARHIRPYQKTADQMRQLRKRRGAGLPPAVMKGLALGTKDVLLKQVLPAVGVGVAIHKARRHRRQRK